MAAVHAVGRAPDSYLLSTSVHGADVLEAPVVTVRELRPAESANLAALLGNDRAPAPPELPRGRQRRLAEVTARQGQADFRRRLIEAYGGRCAITDATSTPRCKAAHIDSYDGPATNQVRNGLLLRADLPNLFDQGLIWIDDSYRVHVAEILIPTPTSTVADSASPGRVEHLPDKDALGRHRRNVAGQPK